MVVRLLDLYRVLTYEGLKNYGNETIVYLSFLYVHTCVVNKRQDVIKFESFSCWFSLSLQPSIARVTFLNHTGCYSPHCALLVSQKYTGLY